MVTKLLFMCTGNSIRSQMAEGFARHLTRDGVLVLSAGVVGTEIHPATSLVMRERGIDISPQTSKSLWAIPWWDVDLVVTLSEEAESCWTGLPVSVRRLHWPLRDPSRGGTDAEALMEFRAIRDQIESRVRTLLADLRLLRGE